MALSKALTAVFKANNISTAGTSKASKAEISEFMSWAVSQRENGVEGGLNIRMYRNAIAEQAAEQQAEKAATEAKAEAKATAETVAAQVAGFVAVFSQGLGITVPAEMQGATETALTEAGYVVAARQLTSGRIKFSANGGGRRSRSEYETIVAALHAAGSQQGKSSRCKAVTRPEYLAIVGNTRDFLACGWSDSAGNGLVKAARRMGFSVAFNKGETKAADTLVLTAPPAKKSKAS